MRQFDPDATIQRTGHGKLVETQNGEWWVMYLMGRPNKGHYTTIGRESGLDPVTWLDDGWFIINDRKGPSTTQKAPDLPEKKFEINPKAFYDIESYKGIAPGLDVE